MKNQFFYLFAFLTFLFFAACNNLDDGPQITPPRGDYDGGILISNEGNFGASNGDVSFITADYSTVDNNIYHAVNGTHAGDVLQHIGFYEDRAYLVLNNSNKVLIVDRFTFEKVDSIINPSGSNLLNQPRNIAFAQNKAFVSCAGNQSLQVYSLNNYQHLQSISLSSTPNQLLSNGQKIFVEEAFFGSGNSVGVVDPGSYAYSSISVANGLNGIAMHQNGQNLYALTNGTSQEPNRQLHAINTTTLNVLNFPVSNVSDDMRQITYDNENLYFTSGNRIYKSAVADLNLAPTVAVEVPDNSWSTLYGMNVINNVIFTSDANGFTQNGIIRIYNTSGALMHTHTTSIGPNNFYLNQ